MLRPPAGSTRRLHPQPPRPTSPRPPRLAAAGVVGDSGRQVPDPGGGGGGGSRSGGEGGADGAEEWGGCVVGLGGLESEEAAASIELRARVLRALGEYQQAVDNFKVPVLRVRGLRAVGEYRL